MNNDFQFPLLRSHRQRLEVIKRLRSMHPNKKALSGATRLSYLNKWNLVDLVMAVIVWAMVLPALLNQAFSLNLPHFNWDKTPLLVIFSISVSLRMSNGFYERFMLKQMIRIRITSYNVCYTKLLRFFRNPFRKMLVYIVFGSKKHEKA